MDINDFNQLPKSAAYSVIDQCCAAPEWVTALISARPYASFDALLSDAKTVWRIMDEKNLLAAFLAHPHIGNTETLRAKFANTKALAACEQSSITTASEKTLYALAEGNKKYYEKFGFIFIVFATGKSADEMLALLQARLPNDRETELKNAAIEQHKITELRLRKLFSNGG